MINEYNETELLEWYILAGVDETCADDLLLYQKNTPLRTENNNQIKSEKKIIPNIKQIIDKINNSLKCISSINELNNLLNSFDDCNLKKTACSTVLGEGSENAKILIISDMPNADDDKQGKIFMGHCGLFFDKLLKSINLSREDCFISYLIPWRPPGNRKPTNEEIIISLPFIKKQIEIINPDLILLLGGIALNLLSEAPEPISKVRGQWTSYKTNKDIPTIATYHPGFILQNTSSKSKLWADLLRFKKKIDELK